jgi:hypothetical protein
MTDDAKKPEDELEALKQRVAELEAKAKPPEPFKPVPYQRFDPTERMSMPPSALQAMLAAEPRGFMRDVVRDNQAPQGRPGAIPTSQQQPSNVRAPLPSPTPGWVTAPPLSNPPGTGPGSPADRIVDEFDRRDRAELVEREARLQAMEKLAERSK